MRKRPNSQLTQQVYKLANDCDRQNPKEEDTDDLSRQKKERKKVDEYRTIKHK
jgi:hypothetical protein